MQEPKQIQFFLNFDSLEYQQQQFQPMQLEKKEKEKYYVKKEKSSNYFLEATNSGWIYFHKKYNKFHFQSF